MFFRFFHSKPSVSGHRRPREAPLALPSPELVMGIPMQGPFDLDDLPVECFFF